MQVWAVKDHLRQHLLTQVEFDPQVSLVDSMAVPICRFARADRCRRLRELAAWGHDEVAKQTYLGLRAHLRVGWPGVLLEGRLVAANVSDLAVGEELVANLGGWVLADRNYGSRAWPSSYRRRAGGCWPNPRGARRCGQRPPPRRTSKRRRLETVIGQLTGRHHLKRVWARDAWHLWSRWLRKLLSHTLAVLLCQRAGLGSLRFADLISS